MTTRLYYDDSSLAAFDALVTAVDRRDDRLLVAVDRTAFYPTSGGQPFDTGTLAGRPVVDVIDEEDGAIVHVLAAGASAAGPLAVGDQVRGEIDWTRRFDHMQQHTGQHVLSAAFQHLFDVRTVSFHLGAEVSTIDLSREVTQAELAAVEREANRAVWEDRIVSIRYATGEEAAAMPLRKEPKRGGTLRLIEVADFDLSACGGTHVARTGAIGIIAVSAWERFKGGHRIEFVCGGRALARFGMLRDAIASTTRLLSVTPPELPGAVERMQADARDHKRAAAALQAELARYRGAEFAHDATPVELSGGRGAVRLVARSVDADAAGLKALASAVADRGSLIVVLVSEATPALVVVARSSDVTAVSAQQVLAALVAKFGGRGGGRPELAQGGGLNGTAEAILAAAAAAL